MKNRKKKVVKRVKRGPIRKKHPAKKKKVKAVVVAPAQEPKVSSEPESFDIDEWMEEQGLKRGEWETYHRVYDKEFCEIRLKDGSEVGPCWPHSGKFVRWDTTEIPEGDVTHIRYFKLKYKVMHEEDEDGHWRRGDDSEDETYREEESDGEG